VLLPKSPQLLLPKIKPQKLLALKAARLSDANVFVEIFVDAEFVDAEYVYPKETYEGVTYLGVMYLYTETSYEIRPFNRKRVVELVAVRIQSEE